MKKMNRASLLLLATLSLAGAAGAQEFPSDPHEFLLARLAAEEGRFDEALEHLGRVIKKEPGNPVLLYERAMILVDAGRVDRAESELRAAVKADPAFYDANRLLGRILLDRSGGNRGKVEEALVFLQAAFKANPDDLSTGVAVSQLLGSLGRVEESAAVLATMVERAPDQRSLNFNYAQALTKLGRGDESKQYLERTIAIDPTFAPAILGLLDIYQQSNEWQKAAEVIAPLIAEDPMNLEMQRQQAYFYLRAGDARAARERFRNLVAADPKDARSQFYLAEALNDLEEYAESEVIFRKLLEADPDDSDLISSLGISLAGQKKWDEAQKAFNSLLAMPNAPDNIGALARTQLAYIDLQKENFDAAVETAKSIFVFRDKPNTQAVNIALEALRRQKKYDAAVALLEPLLEKFPNDTFLNARFTEMLARSGNTARAKEHAAAQVKLGPRNAIATAEAYMQAENYPAAIAVMNEAIASRPEDLELRFQLGSVLERAGDRKGAEQTFLTLLETKPDHAPSLNYLGYMWAESGVNLAKAEEMLTRAVGQEPENGAYVDSLGWVYFRQGKLELAERYLTDATRLLPRDPTVLEHLADVLAQRGNKSRAVELYRAAIELDPESKDIEKIRTKIAELERHGNGDAPR
jgi:predicted Zn-dependent protease